MSLRALPIAEHRRRDTTFRRAARGKDVRYSPGCQRVSDVAEQADAAVEVFWRPGCPYCASLRRDLARRGVSATWRNIWADEAARAVVRAANAGNETVPTVRIGQETFTNPSGAAVARVLGVSDRRGSASGLAGSGARARRQRLAFWLLIALLIIASVLLDVAGHADLSWGVDVVALGARWVTRPLRR